MELENGSLTDWIQLIFAICAGIYALYLFRESNKEKRNAFVLEILNKLYNDSEIRTLIYSVDTNTNVDEIRYRGALEQQADKTIQYFDYIGYLIKNGNLKLDDIKPFKYQISRILNNGNVKNYIKWLREIGVTLDNLKYLKN